MSDRGTLGAMADKIDLVKGTRVVYVASPVFDEIIKTGKVGIVDQVQDGWVFAWWPRSGLHSVPLPREDA